jgi:hypothetical protein
MITRRRRGVVGAALAALTIGLVFLSGEVVVAVTGHQAASSPGLARPPASAMSPKSVTGFSDRIAHTAAIKTPRIVYAQASQVPVLVYHEMNNGCKPAASTCVNPKDAETVSTAQFLAEMNYLARAGYHTISLTQYETWLLDMRTKLPRRPILLTADNGIGNFLVDAEPILARDDFTMTAFLVTGFADGASGHCEPDVRVAGVSYDVQPGCGRDNEGWDLTWPQLRSLSPRVYSFALEAGPSGHFVQDYDAHCQMFDACKIPGETNAAYEARVHREIASGLAELRAQLGSRASTTAWVVPYSDLGYPRCAQSDCTPQPYTGPPGWLTEYAASRFTAVFVEDAYRNGIRHERFRDDINGWMTEQIFQERLREFVRDHDFEQREA